MLKCLIHCVWLLETSRLVFVSFLTISVFILIVYSDIESSLREPESGFEIYAKSLLRVKIPMKPYLSLCKIHVEIRHHETTKTAIW